MFQFSSYVPARTVVLSVIHSVPGERLGAEPRADLDAAALADRVGDQVVRHRVVGAAVDARCRWPASASARCCGRTCCRRSAVVSDHIARPSSPVLRTKLLRTTEFVTPVWKLSASAIWSTMMLFGDPHVRHRAVEPHARPWCGGCSRPSIGRVAHRAADAVDLVGVDALAHVALDREAGQVHVAAAAVGRVLAVEADAGVHRAVRRRAWSSATSLALDDRVPVAGALDRHVVDDDVPVHLVRARRHVHLAGACAWRRRSPCRTRRAESRRPVGSAPNSSTLAAIEVARAAAPTSSESSRSMTVHAALLPGRRGQPDLVAGLVRPAEQQALLVVEVHRAGTAW